MSDRHVTVAVVQAELVADLPDLLVRTEAEVRNARRAGAQLVVFPETWIPGYPAWLDVSRDVALWDHEPAKQVFARMARDSVAVPGPTLDRLRTMARESEVTLVIGITERVEDRKSVV